MTTKLLQKVCKKIVSFKTDRQNAKRNASPKIEVSFRVSALQVKVTTLTFRGKNRNKIGTTQEMSPVRNPRLLAVEQKKAKFRSLGHKLREEIKRRNVFTVADISNKLDRNLCDVDGMAAHSL